MRVVYKDNDVWSKKLEIFRLKGLECLELEAGDVSSIMISMSGAGNWRCDV